MRKRKRLRNKHKRKEKEIFFLFFFLINFARKERNFLEHHYHFPLQSRTFLSASQYVFTLLKYQNLAATKVLHTPNRLQQKDKMKQ